MNFYSRMSRQSSPEQRLNNSSTPGSSPVGPGDASEQPSSSSRRRMSRESEGYYPSWLPRRPPPPAPASTFHSSVGLPESGPSDPTALVGGRKPTPRSVRIVSLQESYTEKSRREPTDQTRVANSNRVWSRAAGAALPPAVFASGVQDSRLPQPKFHSRQINLDILRNPTLHSRILFYLYPILVFAHIPLQTFFDFNTVFILFQVSKFPNPQAPGVPGSGRNWALGAAAYIACWLVWIIVVFIVYEVIYSFVRRWRIRRPLMLPIYLSSSAFNLVSMTSYNNFCFLQYVRHSAFLGGGGNLREGLAETFWFYSQNLPTVALLLPRAGLALALLLAFSTPQIGIVVEADAGIHHRDSTYFRTEDGTLTNYARGVLIANAAWAVWRVLVLSASWIGLWIVSGQGCAGLCGPRYRWDEEDAEKSRSYYGDTASVDDIIPWSWRECTRLRLQEAHDFCLTVRQPLRWNGKEPSYGTAEGDGTFDEVAQVLAAVGFPSVPPPARRGVLSGDLFESPGDDVPEELSGIIPKVLKRSSKDRIAGPSAPLPYPFTAAGAQMSSADKVPFPNSPVPSGSKNAKTTSASGSGSGSGGGSGTGSGSGTTEEDEEEEEGEDEEDDDEEYQEEESEEPSTGRASGSMSSLGHPVTSRYPFQYRRPGPTGNSISSGAPSHMASTSNTRSIQSGVSRATQSTGNRESSDSHSPRSHVTSSSDIVLSMSNSGIPMPPRHPQHAQGRGRQRAGTVPAFSASTSSSPSVAFPTTGRPRTQARGADDSFGAQSEVGHESVDDRESEASHEAAEREDLVGLLSAAPSPRTSLRNRGSRGSISQHRTHGSRSGSNSRTNSQSGSSSSRSRAGSFSVSMRSRAQSLIQNIGAASYSSLELVQTAIRSRANSSMARLEEDSYYSDDRTHSRSGSGSVSANENYTFGQPIRRMQFPAQDEEVLEEEPTAPSSPQAHTPPPQPQLQHSLSNLSFAGPQLRQPSFREEEGEENTTTGPGLSTSEAEAVFVTPRPSSPVDIPRGSNYGQDPTSLDSAASSPPDISTAAQSFVTAPATMEGTTESSGRTVSSWGDISHMVDRSDGAWRPA